MANQHVFIIAEAGVNHNGSIELARKLIDVAVAAKVDAIKFQTFKAENIATKEAKKTEYQNLNFESTESDQLGMLKKLELSDKDHLELIEYCNQKGILFLSTPFDLESADFLRNLGISIFKIASGEITNLPLLEKIGSFRQKVIMSSGMSTINEIQQAIKILTDAGTDLANITILHCNTEYPTPFEDVNLKAMKSIEQECKCPIGYSDHTLGIEVPIAATALGATVIEKHFTLDRSMEGPDHSSSLEPSELISMVCAIRNISKSIGTGEKTPTKSEIKNLALVRKSLVAKRFIEKGTLFSEENLTVKRPGTGISPMRYHELIGTPASKNFEADELIS